MDWPKQMLKYNFSHSHYRQAGNPLAEIASFGMKALKMQKLRVRHFMTRTLGNPNATPPSGTS